MNRKNLTAAVLAGLAGTAGIASTVQAVNINPNGLGQVLIYPYYTTKEGNLTLLSVVNTSDNAKAVKVRFLESMNSIEVLDFNLYMSRHDVWTAAIVDGSDFDENCDIPSHDAGGNVINANQCGIPHLVTGDTSCTVPYLKASASTGPGRQTFLTGALTDNGPTGYGRTAAGHFEMIEMGTLVNEEMESAEAATHVSGSPENCQQLVDAWTQGPNGVLGDDDDGYWLNEDDYGALTDIEDPSGGLFGGAAIVNPDRGTMYSYNATALNGYSDRPFKGDQVLHSFPGKETPSLADGDRNDGRVFSGAGKERTATFSHTIDAVSYVFMHDSIMNEYSLETAFSAASEWVVTFPTKNFYVNGPAAPIAPFVSEWSDNFPVGALDGVYDGACEPVFLDTLWDREEAVAGDSGGPGDSCPPVVSPGEVTCGTPSVPFQICLEANILRFGEISEANPRPAVSEIFGEANFVNIDPVSNDSFDAGWARIDLYAYPDASAGVIFDTISFRDALGDDIGRWYDGSTQYGLPVAGFWAMEIENGYLTDPDTGGRVLATYGGLFNHRATYCFAGRDCREDIID
jgi:hypothetical protein